MVKERLQASNEEREREYILGIHYRKTSIDLGCKVEVKYALEVHS